MNFSEVKSGLTKYPLVTPSPPIYKLTSTYGGRIFWFGSKI